MEPSFRCLWKETEQMRGKRMQMLDVSPHSSGMWQNPHWTGFCRAADSVNKQVLIYRFWKMNNWRFRLQRQSICFCLQTGWISTVSQFVCELIFQSSLIRSSPRGRWPKEGERPHLVLPHHYNQKEACRPLQFFKAKTKENSAVKEVAQTVVFGLMSQERGSVITSVSTQQIIICS